MTIHSAAARSPRAALAVLALGLALPAAAQYQTYFTNFENGAGTEWSSQKTSTTQTFSQFLGNFGGTQMVSLTLPTTAGRDYQLSFDFYPIDTWDGNSTQWGQDRLRIYFGSQTLFNESFSNIATHSQSFSGPAESRWYDLGFGPSSDAIYRQISVRFTANASSSRIDFQATLQQPITDESWGIDNVGLYIVPAPGLAAFGIAGAALASRRRRR